jgi:hypothetical protein
MCFFVVAMEKRMTFPQFSIKLLEGESYGGCTGTEPNVIISNLYVVNNAKKLMYENLIHSQHSGKK